MNYRKKGLQRLLDLILRRQMKRLVLTHKDRLLRFGAELVFALCERQGIEIVMIHQGRAAELRGRNSPRTCWRSSRCSVPGSTVPGRTSTSASWRHSRKLSRDPRPQDCP